MRASVDHAAAKAAFLTARELAPEARADWLAQLEPVLRAEVTALLQAAAGGGFGSGEAGSATAFVDPSGRYRALEVLGEGGMGVVYRGERADGEYRQQVAIKSLSGAGTRLAVVRSERERQFLAQLSHPNIARLLDGGRDARGVPFLVIELINGLPIDQWCRQHAADAATIVTLIATVARAVAYAHRQLIAHRDLKPGNILVDADGVPKLLDFGIAGSLEPQAGDVTADMPPALTLAYASPERLNGDRGGVAGDVYALGVILHELLAGELPYRSARHARAELTREIATGARPRSLKMLPRDRGGRRRLGREIDDILALALAHDPARRYASADVFAADLEALLDGRAVSARPPSVGYRVQVALRRRWPAYAAAAALLAVGLGWMLTLDAQLERTERERDRARASADFLVHVFRSVEPRRIVSGEASARELLSRAFDELERGNPASADARDRPDLYQTLGAVQYQLGLLDDAERAFTRAMALRGADPEHDPRSMATHLNALAAVRRQRGDIKGAAQLVAQALDARRRAADTNSPEYANLLNSHAILLDQLGRHDEARATFEKAIALWQQLSPIGAEGYAGALNNYGILLARAGEPARCVAMQRAALAAYEPLLRPDHPRRVDLHGDLASCLVETGALDEAADHYARALALGEAVLPADDLVLARVRGDVSRLHARRGDRTAALAALDGALAILAARVAPNHPLRADLEARRAELLASTSGAEPPTSECCEQRPQGARLDHDRDRQRTRDL